MASNRIYEEIIYQINTLLKQGEIYPKYITDIMGGKNDYKISQVYTKKNYTDEWIDTIEECIVSLDTIVRNPRKFIMIEEDIVDISLAKSISVESVKHLAQHTNLISSVDKNGTVLPNKILNTSKEESFEVYENRFLYTLLLKLKDFIDIRFKAIKDALTQSGDISVEIASDFNIDKSKVRCKMETNANFPFDAVVMQKSSGKLSNVERISRINMIINDFLSSAFAREMRSCALVRPPITRTNVILKDANFKKALMLWQFVETTEKMDFRVDTVTETTELSPVLSEKYRNLIFLNTVLLQSIANTRDAGESLEAAYEKERTESDEYVTKNIDDFVPDDFPHLKMEIKEIRNIYRKVADSKTLGVADMSKINMSIDRVLRQYRINKAKEDSVTQQRLIAKQLEEEELAKLIALRQERDLARLKRQEEARARVELRKVAALQEEEINSLKEETRKQEEQKKLDDAKQEELDRIRCEEKKQLEEDIKASQDYINKTKQDISDQEVKLKELREEYAINKEELIKQKKLLEESKQKRFESITKLKKEKALELQKASAHRRRMEKQEEELQILKYMQERVLMQIQETAIAYWESERALSARMKFDQDIDMLTMVDKMEFAPIVATTAQKKKQLELYKQLLEKSIAVSHIGTVDEVLLSMDTKCSEEELDKQMLRIFEEIKKRTKNIKIKKLNIDKKSNLDIKASTDKGSTNKKRGN